ncbi:hypothetical protein MMC14_002090 [Varicellaria rhodocarpa]|nr:hypothetical protein [Varicellaria rhodocarpa]
MDSADLFSLPMIREKDTCWITVEIGGHSQAVVLMAVPDVINESIARVIDQCVDKGHGIGGFTTLGFENFQHYVLDSNPVPGPGADFPPKTAFFTITVSNAVRVALQPGALDPAIPAAISRSALDSARLARVSSSTQFGYMSGAQEWATGAAGMKRGGDVTWWEAASTSASDRMIYQCDPGLGSPAVPDCSQIE